MKLTVKKAQTQNIYIYKGNAPADKNLHNYHDEAMKHKQGRKVMQKRPVNFTSVIMKNVLVPKMSLNPVH